MEPSASGNADEDNTGEASNVVSTNKLHLPARLSMLKALKTDGNLASNWKRFQRAWDNYAFVARLNRFEDNFKTATFLSCVGEDALEIFEGMDFASAEDRAKLDIVVNKFQELMHGGNKRNIRAIHIQQPTENENSSHISPGMAYQIP